MITLYTNNRISVTKTFWFFIVVILFLGTVTSFADNFTSELDQGFAADNQNKYGQSIIHNTKALQIQSNGPQSFIAYLTRGRSYLMTKQMDKAEKDFNNAIRVAIYSNDLASAYFIRGYFRCELTNQTAAVDDFSEAIRFNPTNQLAYTARAKIYIAQGHFDSAIIDCNMAILLNPYDSEAYFYRGFAYKGKQNHAKEIESLSIAIELNTNLAQNAEVYYERALAFAGKEDYTNAISDFSRVIQLDPTNAFAYSARGLCLSRNGDYRRGIEDCRMGIQLDKNCFPAYNNLAWLLTIAPEAKLRDGKKAVKYATRACELSGWKDAYCLGSLAAAYAEIGKFDDAIKWENKCILAGLPEKEMQQAHKELELFAQQKPYHADK